MTPGATSETRGVGGLRRLSVLSLLAVLTAQATALSRFAPTLEEHRWERVYADLGFWQSWTTPTGSYRPVCASYLLLQQTLGLSWYAKFGLAFAIHLANLALWYWLLARALGRRVALMAVALAGSCSAADETVAWLGARCDAVFLFLALAGSHFAFSAIAKGSRCVPSAAWLAALCAMAASLAKETGFVVPWIWLAFAVVHDRSRLRLLMPALLGVALTFVLRTIAAGGLGSYVASYLGSPLLHFPTQLAKALSLLVLGAGPDAGLLTRAFAAVAGLLAGLLLWLVTPRSPRRLAAAATLGLLFVPTLLLASSRALYPIVFVLGAWLAVTVHRTRRGIVVTCVGVGLVWQVFSSLWSVQRWTLAYNERRQAATFVQRQTHPASEALLLGPRASFRGHDLGWISGDDLPESERVPVRACLSSQVDRERRWSWLAPREAGQPGAPVLAASVVRESPCEFSLATRHGRCDPPPGAELVAAGARSRLNLAQVLDPVTLFWLTPEGRVAVELVRGCRSLRAGPGSPAPAAAP